MKKLIFSLLLMLGVYVGGVPAQTAMAQDGKVEITGLIDRQDIVGGDTVFVALTQKIAPGWHTYWRNPGDSGTAPTIDWDLPKGALLGKLLWPTPHKIPYGPLTNYGYEGEVTLLQTVTLPDPLPETPFDITAHVDLLVCDEICVPEYHEVKISVTGEPLPDQEAVNIFGFVNSVLNDMPTDISWRADYQEYKEGDINYLAVDLEFQAPSLITGGNESVKFELFPHEWGIVDNSSATRIKLSDDKKNLRIFRIRGERPIDKLEDLTFLLAYRVDENRYGALKFSAVPDPAWKKEAMAAAAVSPSDTSAGGTPADVTAIDVLPGDIPAASNLPATGLPKALIFAFLGGLILNLMPCVFPVLSLKALHLVKMSEDNQRAARLSGLAYMAGIVLSFLVLAGVLIAVKGASSGIGWGFHLQNPVVVSVLATILFLFGLNLSGVFDISGNFAAAGSKLAEKEGAKGSFFTGVLAAVVATPCTAPFMGVAIGYAMLQSATVAVIVFVMLALGLAMPYLLLSFFPALRGFMPKPGLWMQRFKEFLAFPLYASAAWLIWVLSQQVSSVALLYALMFIVTVGLLVWVIRVTPSILPRALCAVLMLGFAVLLYQESTQGIAKGATTTIQDNESVLAYSPEGLVNALQTEHPVFVNMTAAWCITCKVNERVALDKKTTRDLFAAKNVLYIKGDWTNQNAEIAEYLGRYGRNGVPLYVYYGAPNSRTGVRPEAVVLPQVLTPEIMRNHII